MHSELPTPAAKKWNGKGNLKSGQTESNSGDTITGLSGKYHKAIEKSRILFKTT